VRSNQAASAASKSAITGRVPARSAAASPTAASISPAWSIAPSDRPWSTRTTPGGSWNAATCEPSWVTQVSDARSTPYSDWRTPRTQTAVVWV
jgi:hypothetical protein